MIDIGQTINVNSANEYDDGADTLLYTLFTLLAVDGNYCGPQ